MLIYIIKKTTIKLKYNDLSLITEVYSYKIKIKIIIIKLK